MLPKYRGIYPVFWAMINGEKEIGITIHFINEKIDDGDIILISPATYRERIYFLDKNITFASLFFSEFDPLFIGYFTHVTNIK